MVGAVDKFIASSSALAGKPMLELTVEDNKVHFELKVPCLLRSYSLQLWATFADTFLHAHLARCFSGG